ncbi:PAS domain S-box protein [Archaeoglobus sp.]
MIKTFQDKKKNPDPPLIVKSLSKTGEEFWIEVRTRYAEIGGEPYCLVALTDVTERVRLQREVNSLNEYLRFLNSMLRHDILNIFTRMLAYVDFFRGKVQCR